MPYKVIEHTADYQIEARGKDLVELFSDALAGMMAFLKKSPPSAPRSIKRKINLRSDNETLLLIDFLSEALRLSQTHREIYSKAQIKIKDTKLSAELAGIKVDAFDDEIKAVTYHGAEIKKDRNGQLIVTVLFDI